MVVGEIVCKVFFWNMRDILFIIVNLIEVLYVCKKKENLINL